MLNSEQREKGVDRKRLSIFNLFVWAKMRQAYSRSWFQLQYIYVPIQ